MTRMHTNSCQNAFRETLLKRNHLHVWHSFKNESKSAPKETVLLKATHISFITSVLFIAKLYFKVSPFYYLLSNLI